jgi:helix-turn-helix protein
VNDLVSMSPHELSRAEVMQQLKAKRITQAQAAEQLGLTVRQVKRLWRAYRAGGAKALVSKRRGRPSNNQLPADVKAQARQLITQHYADFGPTLAHEKLTEVHHLMLSVETVRKLMVADDHWEARRPNKPERHQLRQRRPRRGELVQVDGSPYAWFEDRAPACNLLVYIDDATGELLELFFTPTETTVSYFAATRRYLTRHGRPIAFYSDKHSIFRLTNAAATSGTGLTQFGRAMTELEIEITRTGIRRCGAGVCANSPQAKGRVERVNQTLSVDPRTLGGKTGWSRSCACKPSPTPNGPIATCPSSWLTSTGALECPRPIRSTPTGPYWPATIWTGFWRFRPPTPSPRT